MGIQNLAGNRDSQRVAVQGEIKTGSDGGGTIYLSLAFRESGTK